jgi:protein-disulfide isomerase-like protein with CxxC motif
MTVVVDFWFDPICPWTWIVRRWLDEVEEVRDIQVQPHLMSLTLLDMERRRERGQDAGDLEAAWLVLRVLAACEMICGPEAVDRFYRGIGRRLHVDGRGVALDDLSVVQEAVVEAGLPTEVLMYEADSRYDALIHASHAEAMRRAGPDIGSPVIAIGQFAVFGPVVSPAPQDEAAGRLWDAIILLSRVPGFYELKRGREGAPLTT